MFCSRKNPYPLPLKAMMLRKQSRMTSMLDQHCLEGKGSLLFTIFKSRKYGQSFHIILCPSVQDCRSQRQTFGETVAFATIWHICENAWCCIYPLSLELPLIHKAIFLATCLPHLLHKLHETLPCVTYLKCLS